MSDAATLSIGPMSDRDTDGVVRLWTDCDLLKPWNDPRADIAQARKSGCAEILVAKAADGAILASVLVGEDGHRGWMYYVAVSPRLQRGGLGRRIIAAAEAWLARRGVQKAQLMIRAGNTKVRGFYAQLGYAVQERVVMARWLDGRPNTP